MGIFIQVAKKKLKDKACSLVKAQANQIINKVGQQVTGNKIPTPLSDRNIFANYQHNYIEMTASPRKISKIFQNCYLFLCLSWECKKIYSNSLLQ